MVFVAMGIIVVAVAVAAALLYTPGAPARVASAGNVETFLAQLKRRPDAAPPPPTLDLSQPIRDEAWMALLKLHRDEPFIRAHRELRARYRFVGNPMLLANSIEERMQTHKLSLREAIIRLAEDHRFDRW